MASWWKPTGKKQRRRQGMTIKTYMGGCMGKFTTGAIGVQQRMEEERWKKLGDTVVRLGLYLGLAISG
jgi:hypothetical protein